MKRKEKYSHDLKIVWRGESFEQRVNIPLIFTTHAYLDSRLYGTFLHGSDL